MSLCEIAWRIGQKRLSSHERRLFFKKEPVFAIGAFGPTPKADLSRLGVNFENNEFSIGTDIELLGEYSYAEYRKRWHAAFQTSGDWPVRFAADYAFGEEGVPGDIRTNWELNRHRQFVVLAKAYFITSNNVYLTEFADLFDDWNEGNPFMWGPEWASPMEESIRLVNWLFAAAFLEASGDRGAVCLRDRLCAGAWAMTNHVRQHYSRYSSANNHTIVEAAGVAIASVVFGEHKWLSEALALLEVEIVRQIYPDGVNKEQALHYQLFVMEALCLVSHALSTRGEVLPQPLAERLRAMADYVSACCVDDGSYIEFGDDDGGIILCLAQGKPCYPEYVLAFTTLELGADCRWAESIWCCETLSWLYGCIRLEAAAALPLVASNPVENFPDGGITIVRFDEGRAALAFDHGPLGFGELAAHGHADALSVQLFVDGEPVLIDPGTYIYNGDCAMRGLFRSTRAHNTVCVGGRDQSEALGPFLWGCKANVSGFALEEREGCVHMAAEHDGYAPICVRRAVEVFRAKVIVTDEVDGGASCVSFFHLPVAELSTCGNTAELRLESGAIVRFEAGGLLKAAPFYYSPDYGKLAEGTVISAPVGNGLVTTISILRGER